MHPSKVITVLTLTYGLCGLLGPDPAMGQSKPQGRLLSRLSCIKLLIHSSAGPSMLDSKSIKQDVAGRLGMFLFRRVHLRIAHS